MTGVAAANPRKQFFDSSGNPLVGGFVDVYLAGTTTRTDTWNQRAQGDGNKNTNPIELDARGECVLYLDESITYKFVLKNAAGVVQYTQDNVSGAGIGAFIQAGTGAVTRSSQDKMRETVSIRDFGAVGDGVADDTAAVQAALDVWRTSAAPLRLEGGGGTFRITSAVSCTWTASDTAAKVIDLAGSTILAELGASGDALSFVVQSSAGGTFVHRKQFRNITVSVANANCANALRFNGGNNSGGTTGYLYGCEFSGLAVGLGTAGNGVVFQDNVFESQARGINARNALNTTGYPLLFEQTAGSTGVISSFNAEGINTDGGYIGVFVKNPVADVNLHGVTAIRAQREGVLFENYLGSGLSDIHVENNWESAASQAVGGAGLRVAGRGLIDNVYGVNGGAGKQRWAVSAYITDGEVVAVRGGFSSGLLDYARVQGETTESCFIHDGMYSVSFISQIREVNLRNGIGRYVRKTVQDFVNPASVTPDLNLGSVVYVFMGQNLTVNTPSSTANIGDELEFCFEQNGAGGYSVTFSSDYATNWTPVTTFGVKNTITFRYMRSSNAGTRATGRWVQVCASVDV